MPATHEAPAAHAPQAAAMPAAHEAPRASATPDLGARGAIGAPVDASPTDPAREVRLSRGARPRLQLMRSVAGVTDTAAAALAPAPAPEHAPSPTASAKKTAQALARATAGALAYEDDGRMSVLFPPPGAVTAPVGPVLARDEAEAPAPAPAPTPPATAGPAPTAAPAALDREDLYQDFMRRLRRDVLEQREQIGELY
jgi:hypothetical protein